MSNRHRTSSAWQLLVLASALILCSGSGYLAFGQCLPGEQCSIANSYSSPNPKTKVRRPVASKRTDARAKLPSSPLPQSPGAPPDDNQQDIEQTIEEGNQARDKNDYEQALAYYQKVTTELNPKESRAFYGMGNLYSDLSCNDSAIEAYRHALELKKDYLDAYIGLGYVYINKERYDDAEKQFQAARNLKSNNVAAKLGLGLVYAKKGKYQEAIAQVNLVINDKSIEDKDRAAAQLTLGDIYQVQNKWQDAIAPYEKAAILNPDLAEAYLKLGMAQLMSVISKFGSSTLQEVRTQDMERLSASARQAGDNMHTAINEHHYKHPNAHWFLGDALLYQSNYQGAVSEFKSYLAEVKELEKQLSSIATKCDYGFNRLYADGYWALGFTFLRESMYETDNQRKTELLDEAVKQLNQAIKLKQDYARAYNTLATIYFQQEKYEEAAGYYQKALLYETLESSKANLYSGVGITDFKLGRYNEAIDHLKKSIALDPNEPTTYAILSSVYEAQGNLDEAIVQQKNSMAHEPEATAHTYYFLASEYFRRARKTGAQEDYAEAISLSKKSIEINSSFSSAYFLLGQIYKFYKDGAMADEALANYNKAAEYEPKNPAIYLHMADLYFAVKHNDEAAVGYIRKAIELKPDYPLAYWELGLVYQHKNNIAEAIKQLLKAIEVDPKYLDAYYDLTAIYKAQKNYLEAIKLLTTATEIAPTDFQPYKELAKIYEAQGKNEDAIHYYEAALSRLSADDVTTKNLYLGRIERLRGHYVEAIGYFQKLSSPFDPDQTYYEVGVVYVASKNKKAALEQYQQLVQLKSPLAEELLTKIKEMR